MAYLPMPAINAALAVYRIRSRRLSLNPDGLPTGVFNSSLERVVAEAWKSSQAPRMPDARFGAACGRHRTARGVVASQAILRPPGSPLSPPAPRSVGNNI